MSESHNSSLPVGGVELLIIQPSPFCNINCDYCYLPERDSHNRMSSRHVLQHYRKIISRRFDRREIERSCRHAGEPLALPLSFYKEAFETLSSLVRFPGKNRSLDANNGMLITMNGATHTRARHSSGVEHRRTQLSFTTRSEKHRWERHTRAGDAERRAAAKARHRFHVIAVVTEQALNFADEVFQFFLDLGVRQVGFNIEELEGVNRTSSMTNNAIDERVRAIIPPHIRAAKKQQRSNSGA
jgi:uncharacterized protein